MSKKLTIEDIRNPDRASGFNYVNRATNAYRGTISTVPYHARAGGGKWHGPRRPEAEQAAQDYCDYINGLRPSRRPLIRTNRPKVDIGTTTRLAPERKKKSSGHTAHLGAHHLYEVELYDEVTGIVFRRKVGITAVASDRYERFCVSWGLAIRPVRKAVRYPTKKAAEKAERARIRELEKDPAFRKVARECFAPVELAA